MKWPLIGFAHGIMPHACVARSDARGAGEAWVFASRACCRCCTFVPSGDLSFPRRALNDRAQRVNSVLQNELAVIIRDEVKNPNISPHTTISEVDITNDLEHCKVAPSPAGASRPLHKSSVGNCQSLRPGSRLGMDDSAVLWDAVRFSPCSSLHLFPVALA